MNFALSLQVSRAETTELSGATNVQCHMTHIWVHNPFSCPPSCHLLYQGVLISVWILIPHVSGGTRSVWPFFFLHGRRPLGPHQYLLKAGISIDKCLETTPATTENRIELNGMEWSGVEPPEPTAATSDPPGYGDPFRKAVPR